MTGKYVTQARVIYYQPPGEPTEGRILIGWSASCDDAAAICAELNELAGNLLDAERQLERALPTTKTDEK
ncbi:MAG: hypothetical protein HGA87_02615 [Desulfobulbaceae bacterium]|nr:hypothetical protein [Desulfobulbaceae bacterium]